MYYNNFTSKTSSRGNYLILSKPQEADNLSTTDEVPAPNVSVVRRFHCIYIYIYNIIIIILLDNTHI